MSFIGKLLVVVHVAVSLAVVAWAFGVFTNRIDWNTPPADQGKQASPGLFERQKAAADVYNAAVDRAYTRWSGNLNQVLALEAERYPRRAFYVSQIDLVKTGNLNGRPVTDPVRELAYTQNGFLDIRPNAQRNPFMVRPGVSAMSIDGYDVAMRKLVEDIQASQVRNAQAIVDREKLNKEIVGVTQPMVVKGLRTRLSEQKNIEDEANFEEAYVEQFVTNREAEFGLLRKRRDAMIARMEELQEK